MLVFVLEELCIVLLAVVVFVQVGVLLEVALNLKPSLYDLHENLPHCHVDGNLRDDRFIEMVCLAGGHKMVRLCPFVPSCPRLSSELSSWQPTADRTPPHHWLHPWLPLL